jgi:hypothetical protein
MDRPTAFSRLGLTGPSCPSYVYVHDDDGDYDYDDDDDDDDVVINFPTSRETE